MSAIHVLNVTGILLNGRNDSIESSLRKRLAPARIETFAPIPRALVANALATLLQRTGERIDAFIESARALGSMTRVVGIGRSFGGLMLLAAVAQDLRRLEAFSSILLVEAPLAPDVEVTIPPLLPVLRMGSHHFEERPHYAAKMVAALREADCRRIVTIGTRVDVVASESQKLERSQPMVRWPSERLPPVTQRRTATHVLLPQYPPGFAIETALLPLRYRSHLTWSETKHAAIVDILRAALE